MISVRAKSLKPSATLALAAKAKEMQDRGEDVVSLTVGEPDWDTFASIKEAAKKSIDAGRTKYTPANGILPLRQAIAERANAELRARYDAEQVTVTAGGKFVIFSALQVLVDPGDEVIIPSPYWVSYPTMVELAGGLPRVAETTEAAGFKLTPEVLRAHLGPRTKIVILNSPSNPTGFMYTDGELRALAAVLRDFPRVVVLSDDIYNRLVFNETGLAPHILHAAPELVDRVVVVNGASKTYSMTGWRIGWALGPAKLISCMNKYQSQTVSCPNSTAQDAALHAIRHGDGELADAVKRLRARRDKFLALLADVPGVTCATPDGAFYLWPKVSDHFGKYLGDRRINDDKDFAEALLETQKVVVVPGVEFGAEGYLRLSYCLPEDKMAQAVARLRALIGALTEG
jgi:aspartate aminotransferase